MNGSSSRLFLTRRQLVLGAISSTLMLSLSSREAFARGYTPRVNPPQLPTLAFDDDRGRLKSLLDFRGRVVLLSIWGTWCSTCVKELPGLNQLRADFSNGWFQVLPVAIRSGDARRVKRFFQQEDIRGLAVYTDESGNSLSALGGSGVPFSLLVDPEGREIGRFRGSVDWGSSEVRDVLRDAVAQAGGRLPEVNRD